MPLSFWRLDILQDPHAYPTGCVLLEPYPQAPDDTAVPYLVRDAWTLGDKQWTTLPDGGFIIAADDYSDALWLAADCISAHLHNNRHRNRWEGWQK